MVSHVDIAPSLLATLGLTALPSIHGRNFLPLLDRKTEGWRDEAYFEMSEFITGRGLRTPQYTYAVATPKAPGWKAVNGADRYQEYMMYDRWADPFQHVNLAGRATYKQEAEKLRARLAERISEVGGTPAALEPCEFPYS
jgi:arylsulfatase A-like enzyme